jgi:hypothetical protein
MPIDGFPLDIYLYQMFSLYLEELKINVKNKDLISFVLLLY